MVARLKDPKHIGAVGLIIGNPFQAGNAFRAGGNLRSLTNGLLMIVDGQGINTQED